MNQFSGSAGLDNGIYLEPIIYMKKEFTTPSLEVVKLEDYDILTTSPGGSTEGLEEEDFGWS